MKIKPTGFNNPKAVVDTIREGAQRTKKPKVKVHKFNFKPADVAKPEHAFEIFRKEVLNIAQRKERIDIPSFYAKLAAIAENFGLKNKTTEITRCGQKLAEMLVGVDNGNLAGIIYSLLIKMNANNSKKIETLAVNGLAIAKRAHDPVHVMARSEDLRKIYSITEPQSDRLIKVLYDEKRALSNICKNYDSAKNRFQHISKEMKPIESYQAMLMHIKIQLAKLIKTKEPNNALDEMLSARELAAQLHYSKLLPEIDEFIATLSK